MLILAEWAFFAVVGLTFAGSALVVLGGVALTPVAVRERVSTGSWPSWGGRLAGALAIAGTAFAPIGLWIAWIASR